MIYRRGDVVLVNFPLADLTAFKRRPALVVHDETLVGPNGDHIVIMITSRLNRPGGCSIEIQMGSAEARAMGLQTDSLVVADKIASIDESLIYRQLGACPIMQDVDDALRSALGL